jgi:hypothetical protein
MKAAIMAVTALLWITGCKHEEKHEARADAAIMDTASAAKAPASGVKEDMRKASNDVADTSAKLMDKAKAGMAKAGNKVGEEAKDIKEAMNVDHGKTPADVKLNKRIRSSLESRKAVAGEAKDIHISTDNGMVTITGTVTSSDDQKAIASIVANIAGKAKVKDDLKVAERVGAHTD